MMEGHVRRSRAMRPARTARRQASTSVAGARADGPLDLQRAGVLLGAWQARELRIARGFPECEGLTPEQLEDVYQESALAMLESEHASEEHLQGALRSAIKKRAMHVHRDRHRHRRILAGHARELADGESSEPPERNVIASEDRLVVTEFLTELSVLERKVFCQQAEGLSYRAIATALRLPVNEARNITRACERKRERFQLLYDTGRLCGYRSTTITAIKNGETASEELARRAIAHLQRCAHCRAAHHVSAGRLRDRFQGQAAILLPVLAGRLGWLRGLGIRARVLAHRTLTGPAGFGQGLRERGAVLLGGAGTAKLAAGAAGVALIAGGAIGATEALTRNGQPSHRRHAAVPGVVSAQPSLLPVSSLGQAQPLTRGAAPHGPARAHASKRPAGAPGHAVPVPRHASKSTPKRKRARRAQVEPGGFAYLGVPGSESEAAGSTETVAPAGSQEGAAAASGSASQAEGGSVGGGPFSP